MSWKPKLWHVVVVVGVGFIGLITAIVMFGGTASIDNKFGDQHLKTTLALLELHKARFGEYPATLADLTYLGDWDLIALQSVRYCPSIARSAARSQICRAWALP